MTSAVEHHGRTNTRCLRAAVCFCGPVILFPRPVFHQEVWKNGIWLACLPCAINWWYHDRVISLEPITRQHGPTSCYRKKRVLRLSLVDPDRVAFKNEATVDTASLPQPFIILSGLFFFLFFTSCSRQRAGRVQMHHGRECWNQLSVGEDLLMNQRMWSFWLRWLSVASAKSLRTEGERQGGVCVGGSQRTMANEMVNSMGACMHPSTSFHSNNDK